jgi:hypothetical protein
MKLLTSVLLLSFSLSAAPDDFLGTWKLNPAKCKSEPGAPPPPEGVTMTYTAEGPGVKVTATVPVPGGAPRQIVHTQTYDGKPHDRFEGKPNGETLTHRRIDSRTEETTWHKDGKVMIITTRTVSADGKTLTSVVNVPGKSEPENIMVYERQ